jgi:hypothetical protein
MPDDAPEPTDDRSEVASRLCPHCATISQTNGDFCPNCGEPYSKQKRRLSRRRKAIWVGLTIVAIAVIAGGTAVKLNHDAEARRHRKETAEVNALAAKGRREAKEEERQQKESEAKDAEAGQQVVRRALEHDLEKEVRKDAEKEVAAGELEGPILHASCTSVSGGSSTNLSQATGQYQCIAVNKKEPGGNESGYRYTARINFSTSDLTWHIGGE